MERCIVAFTSVSCDLNGSIVRSPVFIVIIVAGALKGCSMFQY